MTITQNDIQELAETTWPAFNTTTGKSLYRYAERRMNCVLAAAAYLNDSANSMASETTRGE